MTPAAGTTSFPRFPGQIGGSSGTEKGSPLTDSGAKPMDISLALMEEQNAPPPAINSEFNREFNAFKADVTSAEKNKVKKKLVYNDFFVGSNSQKLMESIVEKVEAKNQDLSNCPTSNLRQPNGMLQEDLNLPHFTRLNCGLKIGDVAQSDQSANLQPEMKNETKAQFGRTPPQQTQSFAELIPNLLQVVLGLPNSKTWKRLVRNNKVEHGESSSGETFKKRLAEGLLKGTKKRARTEDVDSSDHEEPIVEAVEQPRREP